MPNAIQMLLALIVVSAMLVLSFPSQHSDEDLEVIREGEVVCLNETGCYGLIEEAIANAPSGSTIFVNEGSYYEDYIRIDKSIRVIGAGDYSGFDGTFVHFIDPEDGFHIFSESDMQVEFESIVIQALARDILEPTDFGVGIEIHNDSNAVLDLRLRSVGIRAHQGIDAHSSGGTINLEINNSNIIATNGLTYNSFGNIEISSSSVRGPLSGFVPNHRIATLNGFEIIIRDDGESHIGIRDSKIEGFRNGLVLLSGTGITDHDTKLSIDSSTISINEIDGLVMSGERLTASILNSAIERNLRHGMSILGTDCDGNSGSQLRLPELSGSMNRIANNLKLDICPPDYPLPEGFLAEEN